MVSVILRSKKDGKETVQKNNKDTHKMSKDTPKYSKLTPKNAREQGGKLLKENGSEYFRKRSEKACKRGRAEKKKIALAQKFGKTLLEPKNKNLRGKRGGRRTAQSHALQKEIKYFKNSLLKSLTFS